MANKNIQFKDMTSAKRENNNNNKNNNQKNPKQENPKL